jgi:hypothetical protein
LSSKSSLRQAEREFRAWGFFRFFATECAVNNDRTRTRNVNSEDDSAYELVGSAAGSSGRTHAASRREYLAITRATDDVEESRRPEFLDDELGAADMDSDPEARSLADARHRRAAVADRKSAQVELFGGQEFDNAAEHPQTAGADDDGVRRPRRRTASTGTRGRSTKAVRSKEAAAPKRKRGRPRNADRVVIPWPDIDRLLVFGEMARDEETGREDLRYPSIRELGRRFGVSGALIGRYSQQHQCMARRQQNRHRAQVSFEQKLVETLAEARAVSTAETIEIVDAYLRAFRDALAEGRVRADNASDFNTMMRLKAFIEGKADSRQEVRGTITLEEIQARHRALQARLVSLDPAVTGEVRGRDRNRACGLPAEPVYGNTATGRAMPSRRRAGGDIEPALRRRVMAHEREDARMDDVLADERTEAPRGAVVALRRRRREDMDHGAGLDDGRGPRRVRASGLAQDTVRHPGLKRCGAHQDVVYARRPGRGWED